MKVVRLLAVLACLLAIWTAVCLAGLFIILCGVGR
jgi:hypothetical protein